MNIPAEIHTDLRKRLVEATGVVLIGTFSTIFLQLWGPSSEAIAKIIPAKLLVQLSAALVLPLGLAAWWIILLFRRVRDNADIGITIHSAHYGVGAYHFVVTDTVRRNVQHGTLRILATNQELCGGRDPAIGIAKGLTIHYSIGSRDRTITILEGTSVVLP